MSTPQRRDTGTDMLLVEVADSVATLTFNNPEKRNAMSTAMRNALPGALTALQDDPEVRVIVATGAGDRAFVSGADISEFGERRNSPEARAEWDRGWAEIDRAWKALDKPVIAMIRGFCIGGGLLTALQADIRIATDDSQFGVPAARLGLGYGFGGVAALTRLVGPAATAEILFSARPSTPPEALAMGLVNRIVPTGRLEAEVMSLATAITQNAPLTIAAVKASIVATGQPAEHRDLARVEAMIEACFQSDDYREGQAAFAEKRSPRFTGK
jgi:enoyl-CoA hydratase